MNVQTFGDLPIFGEDGFQRLLVRVEVESTNKELAFVRHSASPAGREEKRMGFG